MQKMNSSTNSRAFVVLCNNVKFFYRFCLWFPKEEFKDYDFYVVFDNRLKDIKNELESVRDSFDNKNIRKINVVNGDEILDYYKDEFKYAYKNKFCLNNLKDVFYLEKYDYVYGQDDDIVVFRKGKLFDTKSNVFVVAGNLSEIKTFNELRMEILPRYKIFIRDYIGDKTTDFHVGQYFLNKSFLENYKNAISAIYNCEKFVDDVIDIKSASDLNAWYLDSQIIKLALHHGKFVDRKKIKFAEIIPNKFIKTRAVEVTKKTLMFHYAGGKKEEIYKKLIPYLEKYAKKNETTITGEDDMSFVSRKYFESQVIE